MKLKEGFVLHDVGEEHMVVATGEAGKQFNGLIRNNESANFIFAKLLTDTTEQEIVAAMQAVYDAPEDRLAQDVHRVVRAAAGSGIPG